MTLCDASTQVACELEFAIIGGMRANPSATSRGVVLQPDEKISLLCPSRITVDVNPRRKKKDEPKESEDEPMRGQYVNHTHVNTTTTPVTPPSANEQRVNEQNRILSIVEMNRMSARVEWWSKEQAE